MYTSLPPAQEVMITELQENIDYENLIQNSLPIVLFFYANWHEPSQKGGQMSLVFQTLSQRYHEKLCFALLEAETLPVISSKLHVSVVPTFVGIRSGSVVWKLEGANPPELGKIVKKFAENPNEFSPLEVTPAPTDINDRLRALVSSAPVMLFMKGTPEAPRCGFSRKTVEILQRNDVPFSFFDILQDDDVRAGLKKLYDWPTYPQLYVNGQLIGGYDIVNEIASGGESLKKELGIEHLSASEISKTESGNKTLSEALIQRCRSLINQAPVMIFMKGTPDAPRCGFSRTAVQMFRDEDIPFDSFDILSDMDIREGLKVYSDWPTYPQIYFRGALIGGVDILKEMKAETGSLKAHFPN